MSAAGSESEETSVAAAAGVEEEPSGAKYGELEHGDGGRAGQAHKQW